MNDLLSSPPAPSVLAGAVLLDELVALGVTDVVCCPGSRSAPLAYAAARLEAAGRLRLHVRLDERGAGFFALGLAKATGRAAVVITTSGTAVANLAPAMAEARFSQTPLLALTADRPATLVGTRANQTADQVGIFGTIPLGVIRVSAQDLTPAAWRAATRRAVVQAEGRLSLQPGPIHVNVELTPPLIGEPGVIEPGGPFHVEPARPGHRLALEPGPRTVIVAGDMPVTQGRWWAQAADRAQIPLLAEPSSNARHGGAAIAGYRHLLPGLSHLVERVVVTGHPTLSRPISALLSRTDVEIVAVDASGQWPDPGWAVSTVAAAVSLGLGDPAWLTQWLTADRSLRRQMSALPPWSGLSVAQLVLTSLGSTDALVLGSSNPIRDADLALIQAAPPAVFANRGLAGIDGTIATASGVAAGLDRAVVALMGDLTALHDISSLAHTDLEPAPDLTVVVVDDHGGSLFSTLEYGAPRSRIGDLADHFERLFAVPMAVDVAAVAAGYGAQVTTVDDLSGLGRALSQRSHGLRLIRARMDRDGRAEQERRLVAWGREATR